MDKTGKQDIITGNGITEIPLPESENVHTEGASKRLPGVDSIAPENIKNETSATKPQSLGETVSLLQTDCFDLKSFGCKIVILASDGRLYIAIENKDHAFGFDTGKGNITLDGIAVVNLQ